VTGGAYSPKPWYFHLLFYVVHLPLIGLPWTPFAAFALWQLARRGGVSNPRVRLLICWTLAPVIAFTPAEWKLRYYLLPSLPALALLAAPTVTALLEQSVRIGRVSLGRTLAVLAAGFAVVMATRTVLVRPELLSATDQANLRALLAVVAGGGPAVVALTSVLVGIMVGTIALKAWPVLIGLLAAGSAVWLAAGVPALEQAIGQHDSLKLFAGSVATAYPTPAPLVFFGPPIRSVVVYLGRDVPSVPLRKLEAGSGVIATESDYRTLVEHARVSPPQALGEGRVGVLQRSRVVLAAVLPVLPSSPALGRAGP
jgi:4-amino-4-deoxy-L-arabinose transferase-like glycosyltransferase